MSDMVEISKLVRHKQAQLITSEVASGPDFGHEVVLEANTGIRVLENHSRGIKVQVIDGPYAPLSLVLANDTLVLA